MRQSHSMSCFLLFITCAVLCASAGPLFAATAGATLVLDSTACDTLRGLSGGAITAEVFTVNTPGNYAAKQHGLPTYEPISVDVNLNMTSYLFAWIADAWNANQKRLNGCVLFSDQAGKPISELQFLDGLISEVTIPLCDVNSAATTPVSVVITPRATRQVPGAQTAITASASHGSAWSSHSFILDINGLNCLGVTRIETFTVKQQMIIQKVVDEKGVEILLPIAGRANFPNLKITLTERSAQSWRDWAKDFLVKGNSGQNGRKDGFLRFTKEPPSSAPISMIHLYNIGICKVGPAPMDANGEGLGKVVAELYCERMELLGPSGLAPTSGTTTTPATGATLEAPNRGRLIASAEHLHRESMDRSRPITRPSTMDSPWESDWVVVGIGRQKPGRLRMEVEALDGRFITDQRRDYLAVFRRFLLPHHDHIAIDYVIVDHICRRGP